MPGQWWLPGHFLSRRKCGDRAQTKKGLGKAKSFFGINGRRERIRTFDPLHPMQVRYQAALHADEDAIVCQTFRGFWQIGAFFQNRVGALPGGMAKARVAGGAQGGGALREITRAAGVARRASCRSQGFPWWPVVWEVYRLAIIADSIFSARSAFILVD